MPTKVFNRKWWYRAVRLWTTENFFVQSFWEKKTNKPIYITEIIYAASITPEKNITSHQKKKKETRFFLISVAFSAKNTENIQEVKILLQMKGLRMCLGGGVEVDGISGIGPFYFIFHFWKGWGFFQSKVLKYKFINNIRILFWFFSFSFGEKLLLS